MRSILKSTWFFRVFLIVALAGCATPRDIAEQSTKGNLGIEDAQNQVLLLNALRAYKDRPMYFTSISSFTGPLGSASPQFTLGIPLNPSGQITTSSQITPNVPIFTLSALDGSKFTLGITTPVKPEFVQYLIDQGWPRQFVLSLMIREIIYETKTGFVLRIVNDPTRKERFFQFQDELLAMVACGLKLVSPDGSSNIGPELDLYDVTKLSDLISASKEKLNVVPVIDKTTGDKTGKWTLSKPTSDVGVEFAKPDDAECGKWVNQRSRLMGELPLKDLENLDSDERKRRNIPGWSDSECKEWQTNQRPLPLENSARREEPDPDASVSAASASVQSRKKNRTEKGPAGDDKPDVSIGLFVRSPEAIIYYLGELIRAQLEAQHGSNPYLPVTLIGQLSCEPMFKVTVGRSSNQFVSVTYDGQQYSVASVRGDSSAHTMKLISMLVDLQKEASDIPQSTLIRVIPR